MRIPIVTITDSSYKGAAAAKVIKAPVYIIQGEKDQAVLPHVAEALFLGMKANAVKYFSDEKYENRYTLGIMPKASHPQEIICSNEKAVDLFRQTWMRVLVLA